MQAYANWNASTEAAGNLTEREKGSFCFLIIVVSYNARYAKLREVKKPISRIFVVSASAGSFSVLVQPFYVVCTFYHILLFYLSHAYRYFLYYALPNRFGYDSCWFDYSCSVFAFALSCCVLWFTVCGCGWSFQLIFVWTWLSMFLPESSEDAPV